LGIIPPLIIGEVGGIGNYFVEAFNGGADSE
jgi:hypothetical protein